MLMQQEHTQSHKFKQEIINNILNRSSFSKGAFSIKNMKMKKTNPPKNERIYYENYVVENLNKYKLLSMSFSEFNHA
jgi:hypothetical protein